jgi:hypothetical protein
MWKKKEMEVDNTLTESVIHPVKFHCYIEEFVRSLGQLKRNIKLNVSEL